MDEAIRWATPVTVFQRTAMNDTSVGEQPVKAGDRVGMFYDPEVFEDPYRFDVTRDPNPHVAFEGHGAHYCIGVNLARMEIDVMFNAIADLAPNIAQAGEPRRLRHGWLNGVKELQVTYR